MNTERRGLPGLIHVVRRATDHPINALATKDHTILSSGVVF
jgi:hypothetical protein